MENINILYIDDIIDDTVFKYLKRFYINKKANLLVELMQFKSNEIESLMDLCLKEEVQGANVILIDSKLFENATDTKKYNGESFLTIMKTINPYIEIHVISRNADEYQIGFVRKYSAHHIYDPKELEQKANIFYEKSMKPIIDASINKILAMRKLIDDINLHETEVDSSEKDIDKIRNLENRINNQLNGVTEYNFLEKENIDALVELLEEIKSEIVDD